MFQNRNRSHKNNFITLIDNHNLILQKNIMKKSILSLWIVALALHGNIFSKNPNYSVPNIKSTSFKNISNYQYFSKLLIYPLKVDKEININNAGNTFFKISIYDENMALILTLNTSPFCTTSLVLDSFKPGKYTINVASETETHQFNFIKK